MEKVFVTLQKGHGRVNVKATGLVHNFIILAKCWNHDWKSKSNGSMRYHGYRVHKVNLFMIQCAKNSKFMWPFKYVKERSRSKQQVLCATSSSRKGIVHNHIILAVIITYDQCQIVKWVTIMVSTKWPPFMVQCGRSYLWPCKKVKKVAQLHHPSWLLKPWSKVNVKRFTELCYPQSSPLSKCFRHTHERTDTQKSAYQLDWGKRSQS